MFERCLKYEHGCMATYGWKRCKDKYVVPKRDIKWFKYLLQKEKGLYKKSEKKEGGMTC